MDLRKRKQKMCASAEKCTDYVLIFSRSTGSSTVHYLVVDRSGRSTRLLPTMSTTVMWVVENVIGYRVAVLDGFMYVVGGRQIKSGSNVNMCYRYDPRNGQWTRRASLSEPRTAFSLKALDGRLYVCGGRLRDGRVTADVECYDPALDQWSDVRPMPAPRAHHASCVAEGRLFVSGGVEDDRAGTKTFWQYDPASDFWSQADDKTSRLPRVRQRHLMSEYKGTLYSFSGVTVTRVGQRATEVEDDQMTSFDCTKGNIDTKITGLWDESLPRLPAPRGEAGCVVLGHAVYVLGGRRYSDKEDVLQVDRYSMKARKWTECFSLGESSFADVECCVLRVPASNPHFSSLSRAIDRKWVLW